jgi:3-methylcrotonyl-CoA carboxylase alpha subunit
VRLYAENPAAGFLPSTGRLARLALPPHVAFAVGSGPAALRVDSGVREGDLITPHYDPMLAKLIAWGETRAQALARMAQALEAVRIVGPETNVAFLRQLVQSPAFVAGQMDTGLIAREQQTLLAKTLAPAHAALAATCVLLEAERAQQTADPWSACDGWSNGVLPARELHWLLGAQGTQALTARLLRNPQGGWQLALAAPAPAPAPASASASTSQGNVGPPQVSLTPAGGGSASRPWGQSEAKAGAGAQLLHWHATSSGPGEWVLFIHWGALALRAHVVRQLNSATGKPACLHVFAQGDHAVLALREASTHATGGAGGNGQLCAPMPGRIANVLVQAGQTVAAGQPLLMLEAMKMEHTLQAMDAGVIDAVLVAAGEQIQEGALLLRMRAAEASEQGAARVTTAGSAS